MSKLFIANCSKQIMDFHFRVPESNRIFNQKIGIGEQVQIYKDTTPAVIDSIVNQHANYGLVPASEVDRTKAFVGMCYSVDKPMDTGKIVAAAEHNDEVLTQRGAEIREVSAVAINQSLEERARESGGQVRHSEVEIQEETKPGQQEKPDRISETVRVDKEAQDRKAGPKRR